MEESKQEDKKITGVFLKASDQSKSEKVQYLAGSVSFNLHSNGLRDAEGLIVTETQEEPGGVFIKLKKAVDYKDLAEQLDIVIAPHVKETVQWVSLTDESGTIEEYNFNK